MEQVTKENSSIENENSEDHTKEGPHTRPSLGKTVPFWSTIIPVLVSRQLFQSANKIFQPFGAQLESGKITGSIPKFLASNVYSLFFGGLVAAVSGFYAKSNLGAIKTLYADAVSAELGKNKEDVNYGDLLFRSKNTVVRNSVKEFEKVNMFRSLVISTFFLPWHLLSKDTVKPHNIQASVGAGAMGLYVLKNRFSEGTSILEAFQDLVDTKLHHNDSKPYEIITDNDIGNLLVIQRRSGNKSYRQPALDSQAEQNEIKLAQRIADLLNQTYHNTGDGHSHLSLGKFIYLMGNDAKGTGKSFLDQPYPTNIAYVELAGRHNIKEVEETANAIAAGKSPEAAFAQYGIKYNAQASDGIDNPSAEQDSGKKYASSPTERQYTAMAKEPVSHTQRAASEERGAAISH